MGNWGPATATRRATRDKVGVGARNMGCSLQRRPQQGRQERAKTLVAVSGRGTRHPDMGRGSVDADGAGTVALLLIELPSSPFPILLSRWLAVYFPPEGALGRGWSFSVVLY